MREIVLDTETTGLDPSNGDRLVEIGCVELINHMPSGTTYHQYLNPERDIPEEAFRIHGLSQSFLLEAPKFSEVVDTFLEFISNSTLVIHNAAFDLGFINSELTRVERENLPMSQSVDTVRLARTKFPGAQASLDALCRRFEIDNSAREKHGALLDAELLAEVYLQLIGGRQPDLKFANSKKEKLAEAGVLNERPPRPHTASKAERVANADLVDRLNNPIWKM